MALCPQGASDTWRPLVMSETAVNGVQRHLRQSRGYQRAISSVEYRLLWYRPVPPVVPVPEPADGDI
jgi:hypothetical protein